MDGYEVMPMSRAAKVGDIFVTTTGDIDVITAEHFKVMQDGAIVANSGHFDVEINVPQLRKLAKSVTEVRSNMQEFVMKDGRRIYLLAEGRLVNLAAAEGHPAAVMDMSFANQALALEYLVKNRGKLAPKVYDVPQEVDEEIAHLKLKALKVGIDTLTPKQRKYLGSWQVGT